MLIEFEDCARVTFVTGEGMEYTVIPYANSRLAIPKDIVYLKVSLFPKTKKD